VDYKLNLDVSLADLSWPLFIGGQVSRLRSGSIQITYVGLHYDFDFQLQLHFGLYLGPIFLWAFTRTDHRGANTTSLGSHTLVSSPLDSI
jgi:hypothetical protein